MTLLVLSHAYAAPQEASLSSASSTAEAGDVSRVPASPAFSARDLASPPAQNWLKVGGSLFNQNWSPLKQINRENVGKQIGRASCRERVAMTVAGGPLKRE